MPDPVEGLRRWVEPSPVPVEKIGALATSLGLPRRLAEVILRRGHERDADVRSFLRPLLSAQHPAAALPDVERAIDRIGSALRSGETILVHGDYDADGICSAALMSRGLTELGGKVETFVPHRTEDGYDLSDGGLRRAAEVDAGLIVTTDCGVMALEAVTRATREGRDVVVTDHHRPGPSLPAAAAVVNPSRVDSAYPFAELAGVGVAFKLLGALYKADGVGEERLNQHLDLVALGTIADQVPLVGENRMLVRAGLRVLARTRRPGLRALLEACGMAAHEEVTAEDVSFKLAPRLNSVGRLESPCSGLRLLLTEDPAEARELARHLESVNRRRRKADREVFADAATQLAQRFDPLRDRAVVLWGDTWHAGVIGIAASRMVERTHRPAVLVAFDGDVGRGSARSVGEFHLFRALDECAHLLNRFGGHRMAAGFSIRRSQMEAFSGRFREIAHRELGEDPPVEELPLDLCVLLDEVNLELHHWFRHLAPFGRANPAPLLMARAVSIERVERVGPDRSHLRAVLSDRSGARVNAIGFGMGALDEHVARAPSWDVAFEVQESRWGGRRRIQARLRDLRPTAA